jgi:hypothetical protein
MLHRPWISLQYEGAPDAEGYQAQFKSTTSKIHPGWSGVTCFKFLTSVPVVTRSYLKNRLASMPVPLAYSLAVYYY